MATYLVGLAADSGMPLFTRKLGDTASHSFTKIETLYNVWVFAKTNNVELHTTLTDSSQIAVKCFNGSLLLILVSSGDVRDGDKSVHHMKLLDRLYGALVMLFGEDDLAALNRVERFRREIKVTFRLLDALLEPGHSGSACFSDLTGMVDCMLTSEVPALQGALDTFVESINCSMGWVSVKGRVAVATEQWWSLAAGDRALLTLLVTALPGSTTSDIPVYLPKHNPKYPSRLLSFRLLQGVEVCVLCGPKPDLADVQREIDRFWRPVFEPLQAAKREHPRNLPLTWVVDPGILAFLLLHTQRHKTLTSLHPLDDDAKRQQGGKSLSSLKRRQALRSFYSHVVGIYLPAHALADDEEASIHDESTAFTHRVTETYQVCASYKCYFLQNGPHQLFVILNSSTPTFAMRSVAQSTLQTLTKDKNIFL